MPEALAQRYSPQIASRIEGEYQLLPFVGEDIRDTEKKAGTVSSRFSVSEKAFSLRFFMFVEKPFRKWIRIKTSPPA